MELKFDFYNLLRFNIFRLVNKDKDNRVNLVLYEIVIICLYWISEVSFIF